MLVKMGNKNKVVAIVGLCGSGKTIASNYFVKKGYNYIRFGQITLDEVKRQVGLKSDPALEKKIREDFRKKHGMAAFAILNKSKIDNLLKKGNVVVDGLYSWSEYKYMKNAYGDKFSVISIQSSPELRYQRLASRLKIDEKMINRPLEKKDAQIRDYSEIENIEKGGPIAMADITVVNSGDVNEFESKLEKLFVKIIKRRISWDEYFINIMETIALRATCGRGRSGCVIIKNKHILSTGYVGSPPGLNHCDEVGHLMIRSTAEGDPGGDLHDHCVRTIHAEQNAIVHAARIGVSLEGSTLYCQMEPCSVCARMIIAAGIKRVVAKKRYHKAGLTRKMFKEVGIKFDVLDNTEQEYEK
jgi:dCMP deaminase